MSSIRILIRRYTNRMQVNPSYEWSRLRQQSRKSARSGPPYSHHKSI